MINNRFILDSCRYQDHIQVLTTATRLLTNPNKSWLKACQVDFELDDPILPTVSSRTLGVVHYIRITVQFCNEVQNLGYHNLDLQFPIMFTGRATVQQIPVERPATDQTLVSSPASLLSSNRTISYNGNTDLSFSYKSLHKEGEYRLPCFNYPLIAKC